MRGAGLLDASCALTEEPALLETVRRPAGDGTPGRFVVARSLPRGDAVYALLGRAPVVDPRAQDDFEDYLGQLQFDVREPARFWRECGGSLSSAAWNWPEQREHTREGDVVQAHFVSLALPDTDAALCALNEAADIERTNQGFWDSDTIAWHWRTNADPPRLAEIEVNLDLDELWLFASSASRLRRAEQELALLTGRPGPR